MKKTVLVFLIAISIVLTGCTNKETPGRNIDDNKDDNVVETFDVEFVLDGVSVGTVSVDKGDTVNPYTTTLDPGQSIGFWYTDENQTTVFEFIAPIFMDTVLYASVVDSFEVIRQYLIDNGSYSTISEPGRESETYRIEAIYDGVNIIILLEKINGVEYFTTTFTYPDNDDFFGMYFGLSGTKEEHLSGLVHAYSGGTAQNDPGYTWHGIDCPVLDLSDIENATCTTFGSDATINDFFLALIKDQLVDHFAKANQYLKQETGSTLE